MARIFDQIVGHQKEIQFLAESFQRVSAGAAFLFSGTSGVGKKLVARAFAQALLCEKGFHPQHLACGQCGSCLRVEKNQSEGMLIVEPQGEAQGAPIKIEQAQHALEYLSLRSVGRFRVLIFDSVQNLNPQAANALLKSIEEPPEGTFFFMITSNLSSVLATIRSRCQVVHFRPVPLEQMAKLADAPQWLLKSSRGSFERLTVLQAVGDEDLRVHAMNQLQAFLMDDQFMTENPWRDRLREKASSSRTLYLWSQFLRDAAVLKMNEEKNLLSPDLKSELEKLVDYDMNFLLNLSEVCLKTVNEINQQKDPVLLIESLWVQKQHELGGR